MHASNPPSRFGRRDDRQLGEQAALDRERAPKRLLRVVTSVRVPNLEMPWERIPAPDISDERPSRVLEDEQVTRRPAEEMAAVGGQHDQRASRCASWQDVDVRRDLLDAPLERCPQLSASPCT